MSSEAAAYHRRALVAALAVTAAWSSSWVIIRVGLRHDRLPPLTFAGLRYVAAAVALWAVVALNRKARGQLAGLTPRSAGHLAVLGVVFYALTQGAQFVAIDRQPVATTSLVLTLTPLLVGLASGRLLSEHPGRAQAAAAVLVPRARRPTSPGRWERRRPGWPRAPWPWPPTLARRCWGGASTVTRRPRRWSPRRSR